MRLEMNRSSHRYPAASILILAMALWAYVAWRGDEASQSSKLAGQSNEAAAVPMMAIAPGTSDQRAVVEAHSVSPTPTVAAALPPAPPREAGHYSLPGSVNALPVFEHRVAQKETLGRVARQHRVSDALLAEINGLSNRNRIRTGDRLRVLRGPFRAVIDKSRFQMDVYLGDRLVHTFKVGLGTNGSTPTGVWRVTSKLENPAWTNPKTFEKYSADDPANPVGEHWIGLEGLSGECVGKHGFGIHGTIEPDSIGRNASLGCVRMLAPDVATVYKLLVEGASTVEIR